MTVCFTGHRSIEPQQILKLPDLLDEALDALIARGAVEFRTGGALGFDTLAALKVLEKKKQTPHIRLVLMLPCRDQTKGWSQRNVDIFGYILAQADRVHYVSDVYTPFCMHERNRALVEGSQVCVAFCSEESGGSAYTVAQAKKQGLEIVNLYMPQ